MNNLPIQKNRPRRFVKHLGADIFGPEGILHGYVHIERQYFEGE